MASFQCKRRDASLHDVIFFSLVYSQDREPRWHSTDCCTGKEHGDSTHSIVRRNPSVAVVSIFAAYRSFLSLLRCRS